MRLIDADALIKAVDDFPNCYNGWSDTYDKAFIIGAIEEAPTIEAVSVVHGEWIVTYTDGIKQTECSACGESFTTYDVYGWNYCPWCGARMKGAEDE